MRELSPRQRAFVVAYARHGVAERAAIEAGYSNRTARGSAARLLANAGIRAELSRISSIATTEAVADLRERREFWTRTMRDGDAPMRERLKASELLGKSEGDFLDRVEQGGEMVVRVVRE